MGSLKFFLQSKTSTEDKMNFSIVLLLVVAVVATSARPSDVDHHWEIFKANHPKATHLTEELVRKGLFAKVHQMIEEHNSGNHSYTMAHNMFSDMTEQEKEGYMGLKLPEGFETDAWTASNGVESRAPASLDWRTDSCLQPVKDQGQCGSCWAFSAIGSFEFQFCKTYGTSLALSEQQLVDCDTYDGGCQGGWYYNAWTYLQSYGSNSGYEYGYTGAQGGCRYNSGAVYAVVSSFSQISSNPNSIMDALQYGPVSVALNAMTSFQAYNGGVYSSSSCGGAPNHAVIVVGYGNLNGQDYWVVRNSWTAGWGQGGYALVLRGYNMCNIENYVWSVRA